MDYPRIAKAVSAVADLLDSCGVTYWPDRLRKEVDGLHAGDPQAARDLRSCFGGMGNLDDLLISPANGHPVSPSEGKAATRKLWHQFEEILQAGLPIRRNWPASDKEADRIERSAKQARNRFDRDGADATSLLREWEESRRAAGFTKEADGTWTRPPGEGIK